MMRIIGCTLGIVLCLLAPGLLAMAQDGGTPPAFRQTVNVEGGIVPIEMGLLEGWEVHPVQGDTWIASADRTALFTCLVGPAGGVPFTSVRQFGVMFGQRMMTDPAAVEASIADGPAMQALGGPMETVILDGTLADGPLHDLGLREGQTIARVLLGMQQGEDRIVLVMGLFGNGDWDATREAVATMLASTRLVEAPTEGAPPPR